MRGTASPPRRRGLTPPETTGSCLPVARSFSPARLHAVGAGRPRIARAGRARLHYVEREDPGHGHLDRATDGHRPRRGSSPCPQPGRSAAHHRPAEHASTARSKNHQVSQHRKSTQNDLRQHLTSFLLRWSPRKRSGARVRSWSRSLLMTKWWRPSPGTALSASARSLMAGRWPLRSPRSTRCWPGLVRWPRSPAAPVTRAFSSRTSAGGGRYPRLSSWHGIRGFRLWPPR